MRGDCLKGPVYRISLAARMSIILSHSEVLLGQSHSVWDSMMLILAAREILYTGPLIGLVSVSAQFYHMP